VGAVRLLPKQVLRGGALANGAAYTFIARVTDLYGDASASVRLRGGDGGGGAEDGEIMMMMAMISWC
jgi:hypothetical protein